MSDSDSDWEEDDQTNDQPTPQTAAAASPTAATASSPTNGAVPSILFACPITLTLKDHPQLGQGIPAGVTLLYDSNKHLISLLAYDAHKRPLLHEPFDGQKFIKSTLPFSMTLGDGEGHALQQVTLVDTQARKWTMACQQLSEATRLIADVGIATLMAKAATGSLQLNQLYLKHDLAKGSGKSCKPKTFVSLQVRGWVVDLDTDPNSSGLTSETRVTGTNTFTSFHPDLTIGGTGSSGATPFTTPIINTTLSDIEVSDESVVPASLCPSSIGDVLSGGKLKTEGGSRLLFLPASADLVQELLTDSSSLPRSGSGSLVLLQLTPLTVSKKKEKKDKTSKDKKKSASSSSDKITEDDPTITDDAALSASSPALESSPTSDAPSESGSFQAWSTSLTSLLPPLMEQLQAMNSEVTVTPTTQQRIVKSLMNETYEGLVADLGLQTDPEPAADSPQAAQLTAIQTRLRALVSSHAAKNSDKTTKGSLASLVTTWKSNLLPILQPLVDPSGPLGEAQLQQLSTSLTSSASSQSSTGGSSGDADKLKAQIAKLNATHAAQIKKLEETNRTLQEALNKQKKLTTELDSKHTTLVMKHIDMEESNQKLSSENKTLSQKAQMCTVFEAGLTDLRTVLEKEIESRQEYEKSFNDLSQFQKNYKLTWLPDKAATHCMSCQGKFGGFFGGKSKGHCRYCGRIFCKECCTQTAIPEFGYKSKVKVCKPCFAFRQKQQGEAAAEAQAEAADGHDDDEDEDEPKKSPKNGNGKSFGSSSAASTTGKSKTQQPSVLSYDSDILDD